jgi:hypothetical protein
LIGGDDLDLDGDPDVADGIDGCVDTDADGDVEFPSGFYRAGTILENDVFLHPEISWAVDEAYSDLAWDLVGVLTHELGHSHGLAHTANVQKSDKDNSRGPIHELGEGSRWPNRIDKQRRGRLTDGLIRVA